MRRTTLLHLLPEIYKKLLPPLFSKPIPVEQYSDCNNCAMCKEDTNSTSQKYFSKKTKCCTFKPIIPNYLIGGILHDSTQHPGVSQWVDQNRQTFPLGIFPTNDDFIKYDDILPDQFGRE